MTLDALHILWVYTSTPQAMAEAKGRSPMVNFRATQAEREVILSEAKRRGISKADLIRSALVGAGVPIAPSRRNTSGA